MGEKKLQEMDSLVPSSALVNDNDLYIDVGNSHMLDREDDGLRHEPGHKYIHMVDIERNIEAEPDIYETEVDDQNMESTNEGDGESVTVPGPNQHIDIENQEEEVIEQRGVNNSDVEEGPTIRDLAARVKLRSKIGNLAAGTSLAGTIAIFTNSGNYREKNLYDKLLLGGTLLFMLLSFMFGVTLLQGRPKSIGRIKFVTGAAIVFLTMIMIFGFALIIRRAY